jgi:hypothetical protein
VTLGNIVATVALDTIVAFVTPLVALLSLPVIWRKEHLLNFSVLQSSSSSSYYYYNQHY